MFIVGTGTAAPPRRYGQRDCWDALQDAPPFEALAHRSRAILRKVLLSDNGIDGRHLALAPLTQAFEATPDALHRRFAQNAPQLASQAARAALAEVGRRPEEIDAVLVSTCTGYLCPGLSGYVVEALGLRPTIAAFDLVGHGCGAALPNLRQAAALIQSGQCASVLSVCVEVCSAAFYLDDDPGVLISACLFGDGAAAVLSERAPVPDRLSLRWRHSNSWISPADRDYLRFEQRNGLLRNILTPQVPALAAKFAETLLTDSLRNQGLRKEQIVGWALHGGGREVIRALEDRLGLDQECTRWTRSILREFGNLSSSSVLFVLDRMRKRLAPGGWWWMSSFGAGFSCHSALLEVQ